MSESILEEAQRLIHGDRNGTYGHPRENFANIAALFSGYLDVPVSDIDVANLMILVKVARSKGYGYHRDTFTDIAGYAGCVERIYEETPEPEGVSGTVKAFEPRGFVYYKSCDLLDGLYEGIPYFEEEDSAESVVEYPTKRGERRHWWSIEEVPAGVEVEDRTGALWFSDEAACAHESFDKNHAPFVESGPRVWDSLNDVPKGLDVEDAGGVIWTAGHFTAPDSWGPFVEVLEGDK